MKYYFIGIKGSGMSALAILMKEKGNDVRGSDVEEYIFTEEELKRKGIDILSFNENNFDKDDIVIIEDGCTFTLPRNKISKAVRYLDF